MDVVQKIDTKAILVLLAGSLLAIKIIHKIFIYPYFTSTLLKAPGPRGSLWSWRYLLYGDIPDVLNNEFSQKHRDYAKEHGHIIRLVGPLGMEKVLLLSPEAVHKCYVSDWVDYPRLVGARNFIGIVAGFGLLTVTGEEHKTMRRALNPAFSLHNMAAQMDMYHRPLYGLVEVLKEQVKSKAPDGKEGKVFHMYEWVSRATLDIICATAFGHDSDSVHKGESDELSAAYQTIINVQSTRVLMAFTAAFTIPGARQFLTSKFAYNHRHWFKMIPWMGALETVLTHMATIRRVASGIVQERINEARAVMESDSVLPGKKDVISLLIQARMKDENDAGFKLSDEQLMEQVLTFLAAGHETTATATSWALWLLATNPDIQDKLRAEVQPVMLENPEFDYKVLKSMTYLEYTAMESLRVWPPVAMTARTPLKGDYIDGVYIPKGILVMFPLRAINSYKGTWGEDAEEFKPERWANLPKAVNLNLNFMTFIQGPHHCIGKNMAILEMKALLAVLVTHFRFEPAYEGQTAHPTASITMKPADNMPLRVIPITP